MSNADTADTPKKLTCGLVRPIADMDGYPAQHWSDVHNIVVDALDTAGFTSRVVSDSDAIGVIHGRIVKNLYDVDLVVCDVSGKNPNVMFELGLRLAFDKPTIVIKDDITSYSFDTSPIEHIGYPRDLRYGAMVDFKAKLSSKAIATVNASNDPGYKSFLQHFGPITVPKLEHREVPADLYILDEIKEMRAAIEHLSRRNSKGSFKITLPNAQSYPMNWTHSDPYTQHLRTPISGLTTQQEYELAEKVRSLTGVIDATPLDDMDGSRAMAILPDRHFTDFSNALIARVQEWAKDMRGGSIFA